MLSIFWFVLDELMLAGARNHFGVEPFELFAFL